jgi:nucleotide-binding universal stress UspA family protein
MPRILVPLDGSAFGEAALPLAGPIARRIGAELELVKVYVPFPHPDVPRDLAEEVEAEIRARDFSYLDDMSQEVRREFEVPVTTALLDGGVEAALMRHAGAHPPDLIVMSTHGRSGPSRFFLGATADRLLRELHRPMLIVRPTTAPADREPFSPKILVPLDGSPLAETVLDEVTRLFPPTVATLHLLRVVVPVELAPMALPVPLPPTRPEILEQQLASARSYLGATALKLRLAGWRVQQTVEVGWSPQETILSYAKAHGCDLIALATRGHGGLERMILGSVADKVIRGASMPVLAVNPPAGATSRLLAGAASAETCDAALAGSGA